MRKLFKIIVGVAVLTMVMAGVGFAEGPIDISADNTLPLSIHQTDSMGGWGASIQLDNNGPNGSDYFLTATSDMNGAILGGNFGILNLTTGVYPLVIDSASNVKISGNVTAGGESLLANNILPLSIHQTDSVSGWGASIRLDNNGVNGSDYVLTATSDMNSAILGGNFGIVNMTTGVYPLVIDSASNVKTSGDVIAGGISVQTLNARLSVLEGLVGGIASSGLSDSIAANVTAISANEAAIASNDADILGLQTELNGLSDDLVDARADLQAQIDALVVANATLRADIEAAIAENAALIADNAAAIAQSLSYIKFIETALSAPGASGISRYQRQTTQ